MGHPPNPHPREGDPGSARPAAPTRPPTVRQVYALAAALCEKHGEGFPETRAGASELIERLRTELGHPQPRLEGSPLTPRRPRRRRPPTGPAP